MTVTLVCSQNAKTGELKYTGVTEENESVRMHVTKYICLCTVYWFVHNVCATIPSNATTNPFKCYSYSL